VTDCRTQVLPLDSYVNVARLRINLVRSPAQKKMVRGDAHTGRVGQYTSLVDMTLVVAQSTRQTFLRLLIRSSDLAWNVSYHEVLDRPPKATYF
jgi:hypothetical protein